MTLVAVVLTVCQLLPLLVLYSQRLTLPVLPVSDIVPLLFPEQTAAVPLVIPPTVAVLTVTVLIAVAFAQPPVPVTL